MKILSLRKHEHLTTGRKILWKRGEIAPKEAISSLFNNIFNISLTSRVQLHIYIYIYIWKMWLFVYFFPNSANLICRGTDISKYLIESLGIRDNESRLYYLILSIATFCWSELHEPCSAVLESWRNSHLVRIWILYFGVTLSSIQTCPKGHLY